MNDASTPPPAAILAEKAVLCEMMWEPDRLIARAAADGLTEDSFSTPANRDFFRTIREDFRAHGDLDLIAFIQRRQTEGTLDRMGGPASVTEIHNFSRHAGAWTQYISQIKAAHALRTAQEAGRALAEADSADDAVRKLTEALEATRRAAEVPRRSIDAETAWTEFIAGMKHDHEAGELPGASTGICELDHITGGMKPGQLWVYAAQSTHGKSVLMLQTSAEFFADGKRVLVCSLEMTTREIIGRLASCLARVDLGQITQPRTITSHTMDAVKRIGPIIAGAHLHIDPSARQTLDSIRAEAERLRDTHDRLDLVVVDYIQLIDGERGRNETREGEIARVSRGLKQLAKDLDCPVLTASQLSNEGRTRESRAIEHDADVLLYVGPKGITVGKNRHGRRGDVLPLFLDGPHQRFTHARP